MLEETKWELFEGFLKQIDYPLLVDISHCIFYLHKGEIYWNTDNNEKDLFDEEGETYSGFMPEGYKRDQGKVICNVDTQQGYWMTQIFSAHKEIFWEDLEKKYG